MEKGILTPKFWESIYSTPELVIDQINLTYVSNKQLTIKRERQGEVFTYLNNDQPVKNQPVIDRITKLVIPPAWNNVYISVLENGHLQAVGRDAKNRKQYRYHPLWNKVRNQVKFYRMYQFGEQLPKIRAQVDKDLDQDGWCKTKVLGLIIRLLEETHIRIGNEQYAKRNKTYGLSTLRNRHLKTYEDTLRFEFVGKKGKKHSVSLRNKKLINLVLKCEEIPGWELFQYFDSDGNKNSVDSSLVNDYLHKITNKAFTAKDFRTWAATQLFFNDLMEYEVTNEQKQVQKNILKAYDHTAKALGNTRNVCRKYYVHPMLPSLYESGELYSEFEKLEHLSNKNSYMSNSEVVILDLLKNYKPNY